MICCLPKRILPPCGQALAVAPDLVRQPSRQAKPPGRHRKEVKRSQVFSEEGAEEDESAPKISRRGRAEKALSLAFVRARNGPFPSPCDTPDCRQRPVTRAREENPKVTDSPVQTLTAPRPPRALSSEAQQITRPPDHPDVPPRGGRPIDSRSWATTLRARSSANRVANVLGPAAPRLDQAKNATMTAIL